MAYTGVLGPLRLAGAHQRAACAPILRLSRWTVPTRGRFPLGRCRSRLRVPLRT